MTLEDTDCRCPHAWEFGVHETDCQFDEDEEECEFDSLIDDIYEEWEKHEKAGIGEAARTVLYEEGVPPLTTIVGIERELSTMLGFEAIEIDTVCTCQKPGDIEPVEYGHLVPQNQIRCQLWDHKGWVAREHEWNQEDRLLYRVATVPHAQPVGFKPPTEKPVCKCTPEKIYWCGTCGVYRPTKESAWQWDDNDDAAWGGYGGLGGAWTQKCRHYGETVEFPSTVKINLSSHHGWSQMPKDKPVPDFGLYAYDGWGPDWIATLLPWKDYGLPTVSLERAAREIVRHYNLAVEGHVVELGCMGGHGRTGTMLACMAILGGVPVLDAVEWVRKEYCTHAVEGREQVWFVGWFGAWMNGEPLPEPLPPLPVIAKKKEEKPKNKKKTAASSAPSVGTNWKAQASKAVNSLLGGL